MAQSGPNYAGSVVERTGDAGQGTWTSPSNAQGSTESTYATWNKPAATNQVSKPIEGSSFGTFTGVASGDTINFVRVAVDTKVANTTRMLSFQVQLWDGTTAQIGATQTCTLATADTVDTFDITGVTYSQLSTLRVRVIGRGAAANGQSSTGTVDWMRLTVDYTAGAKSVDVLQTSTTDSAQAQGKRKAKQAALAQGQPDAAQSAVRVKSRTMGLAR